MTLSEIRQSETLTIGEKKVLFYDRMLTLTACKRGDMSRYGELLDHYFYWRLKVYGYASGKSGVSSYKTAQHIMRKISKYRMRLSRTDI